MSEEGALEAGAKTIIPAKKSKIQNAKEHCLARRRQTMDTYNQDGLYCVIHSNTAPSNYSALGRRREIDSSDRGA